MDDLKQLRYHLNALVDTMLGIKHSCIRHNDRDGECYAQGKIDAYSCVIDILNDLLEEDDSITFYPY